MMGNEMTPEKAVQGERLYTSDLHFFHPLVAKLRGFSHTEPDGTVVAHLREHNEAIIRNWNAVARDDTEGWILGDLTIGPASGIWPLLAQMRGQLNVVWGNHDPGFPGHRGAHRHQREWMRHVNSVQSHATVRTSIGKVMLSHFPYAYEPDRHGQPAKARYPEHRLPDLGRPLLHGHTHENRKVTSDHEVHVGLDAWDLYPVRERDALALLGQPREAAA